MAEIGTCNDKVITGRIEISNGAKDAELAIREGPGVMNRVLEYTKNVLGLTNDGGEVVPFSSPTCNKLPGVPAITCPQIDVRKAVCSKTMESYVIKPKPPTCHKQPVSHCTGSFKSSKPSQTGGICCAGKSTENPKFHYGCPSNNTTTAPPAYHKDQQHNLGDDVGKIWQEINDRLPRVQDILRALDKKTKQDEAKSTTIILNTCCNQCKKSAPPCNVGVQSDGDLHSGTGTFVDDLKDEFVRSLRNTKRILQRCEKSNSITLYDKEDVMVALAAIQSDYCKMLSLAKIAVKEPPPEDQCADIKNFRWSNSEESINESSDLNDEASIKKIHNEPTTENHLRPNTDALVFSVAMDPMIKKTDFGMVVAAKESDDYTVKEDSSIDGCTASDWELESTLKDDKGCDQGLVEKWVVSTQTPYVNKLTRAEHRKRSDVNAAYKRRLTGSHNKDLTCHGNKFNTMRLNDVRSITSGKSKASSKCNKPVPSMRGHINIAREKTRNGAIRLDVTPAKTKSSGQCNLKNEFDEIAMTVVVGNTPQPMTNEMNQKFKFYQNMKGEVFNDRI